VEPPPYKNICTLQTERFTMATDSVAKQMRS